MIQEVRLTFDERYQMYMKNDLDTLKSMMNERLKFITKEELSWLFAEHAKFINRLGCAEYASDDDGEQRLDPLGRKVDKWGKRNVKYRLQN